ncbi:MAG TPA: phosphodiester glycosidase family protein [Actinomycetota bacterium]|nr:phosphodiester glycosidase family protein [Actinomycetota bacterium]
MPRPRSVVSPRRTAGVVLVCVVASSVAAAGVSAAVAADPRPASGAARIRTIAPGVTYQRMALRGPVVAHVVRIDPSGPSTIDVAPGGRRAGSFARPSSIGRAHGALLAINGDFGLLRGLPVHAFQADGSLITRGIHTGTSFAMRQDETTSFIGTTRLAIEARHAQTEATVGVAGWNSKPPGRFTVAGFTPAGGDVRRPPTTGCAVRLVPDSEASWDTSGTGISRRYEAVANRCGPTRMRVDARTVVLASRRWRAGSDALTAMEPGHHVRLRWSFGWPRVADSVGGVPRLVDDGAIVASKCRSHFCRRHPRTGMGVTADGTVVLLVVDGRSRRSVGMTLYRFALTLASLGATDAMNLDGGGSSAMWIAGRGVVNRPSDPGGERRVVNALLVLPGADPGETRLAGGRVALVDGGAAADPGASDPGSVGGLAEAWVEGSVVDGPVPPAIERIAERFERTR